MYNKKEVKTMPELPEVETVKNTLKKQVLNKQIELANIYWNNIIAYPKPEGFKQKIKKPFSAC